MTTDEKYIARCFDLARFGAGSVSPNPLVGAVIVHEDRIIGEGWHRQYGKAHAEVNAINRIKPEDRHLLTKSTIFVSLEPCCIHRNTPPCTDLICSTGIPKVVISSFDATPEVNGKGVEILKNAGIEVVTGVMSDLGNRLCAIRNHFVTKNRPFVLLKYAQSIDGYLGNSTGQVRISNAYTQRYVHKLRAEYDAILVGTNTALIDNPQLNCRLWFGKPPLRIVLDRKLRVPPTHHLLDGKQETLVVTEVQNPPVSSENLRYFPLSFDGKLLPSLFEYLVHQKISSLLVEGGAITLDHFIRENRWDEAIVITGDKTLSDGVKAPSISGVCVNRFSIGSDVVSVWSNAG